MTTDELIKALSHEGFSATVRNKTISIFTSNIDDNSDQQPCLRLDVRTHYLNEIDVNADELGRLFPKGIYILFNVVKHYIDTPVGKRQPEKKYYVRFLDDGDGTPNYLDYDGGYALYHDKHDATKFAKQQIKDLGLTGPCWKLEEVHNDD